MSEKIIAWNVNSATNRHIFTPAFVGEEIQCQNSDLIVLTEFCRTKNYEEFIEQYLVENGYNYIITSNRTNHNEILLAWKRDKYDVVEEEKSIETNEYIPDFAYVVLKSKKGVEFTLAGIRITIESYDNRVRQLCYALSKLEVFPRVVLGGDFNCLRRKTSETRWNISVLCKLSSEWGGKLISPKGQSIYAEKACCEAYEFAEDHFVVKGIELKNEIYDRSFTKRNSNVYLHGKDFSVYDFSLRRNIWSIRVGSGVPDHAILSGEMCIDSTE